MKLTIIPSDNSVLIDNIGYTVDIKNLYPNIHAVQWFDNTGWIEYTDKPNETISDIDQFQSAIDLWNVENEKSNSEYVNTAEDNKNSAIGRLSETDWVELNSVSDSTKSIYLVNKNDFDSYRIDLRAICINPQAGNITFPTKPNEVWSVNGIETTISN